MYYLIIKMATSKTLSNTLAWVNKNKLFLLIITLAAMSFFGIKGCVKQKNENNNYANLFKNKDAQIGYWKSKDSVEHAVLIQTILTGNQAQIVFKSKLDSISNVLKIKNKQITEYISIIEKTKGEVNSKVDTVYKTTTITIKGKDSIIHTVDYLTTNFKDHWLELTAKISNGNFNAQYTLTDSLTIVGFWKKKNFFSKKNYYIDISSSNPNAHILNTQNLKITSSPEHKIGLGVFGGYGLGISNSGVKPQVMVGVGVYYKLF